MYMYCRSITALKLQHFRIPCRPPSQKFHNLRWILCDERCPLNPEGNWIIFMWSVPESHQSILRYPTAFGTTVRISPTCTYSSLDITLIPQLVCSFCAWGWCELRHGSGRLHTASLLDTEPREKHLILHFEVVNYPIFFSGANTMRYNHSNFRRQRFFVGAFGSGGGSQKIPFNRTIQ